MIDETIGSIGSTHGVSDSSTPARKNAPTTGQKRPSCSIEPSVEPSPADAADVPPASEPAGAGSSLAASLRTLAVPPKPLRLTLKALSCGG